MVMAIGSAGKGNGNMRYKDQAGKGHQRMQLRNVAL